MILTADYHTHTVYSHGKGDIFENASAAQKIGLKEVGITDHGFSHPAFGLKIRKLPKMRLECDEATVKSGVKVLLGIESNIVSTDGTVDLKQKNYDYFDIFLAGLHKFVKYKFGSIFTLFLPDLFLGQMKAKSVPQHLIKTNTKTFINVIKNNPVDIITHLNYGCFADAVEVAKVAADYGTYLEISAKKTHLTDEEWYKIKETNVRFVLSSDAHTVDRVGEISLAKSVVDRIGIPLDRIDNIDGRLPNFRFKNFKEGK